MPTLVIPELKEFSYLLNGKPVAYRLSSGKATEGGEPKIYVNRWQAYDLAKEQGYRLPTIFETWNAALTDAETKAPILTFPAEWQSHLILGKNTPTETEKYIIRETAGSEGDEKELKVSEGARLLAPVEERFEGDKRIIIAKVYGIPERNLGGKKYNPADPETWNPETGFFNNFDANGDHCAQLPSGEGLYAAMLNWCGTAGCDWIPEDSDDFVGFRGGINPPNEPGRERARILDLTEDRPKKPKDCLEDVDHIVERSRRLDLD